MGMARKHPKLAFGVGGELDHVFDAIQYTIRLQCKLW